MRLITNPYFGAMNAARKEFFSNWKGNSVFLSCWTFGSIECSEYIRIRTAFENKVFKNVILVKRNDGIPKVKTENLFTWKYWENKRRHGTPEAKYAVKCKVVQHSVEGLELIIDGNIIDKLGDGNINHYRGFNTELEARNWYNLISNMHFNYIPITLGSIDIAEHLSRSDRKKLDAYYTPWNLAIKMASYLEGEGKLLDPFCGVGSLLEAAIYLGKAKEEDLIGYDIDPIAIKICKEKFPKGRFEIKPFKWEKYRHPRNPEYKRSIK